MFGSLNTYLAIIRRKAKIEYNSELIYLQQTPTRNSFCKLYQFSKLFDNVYIFSRYNNNKILTVPR